MDRLLSFSDDEYSIQKFGGSADSVRAFMAEHRLEGLELMRWENPQEDAVPMEAVKGRHMPYWPTFLDFWRGDMNALRRQFDSEENWRGYYFADTREEFVRQRREEFLDAARMGVRYAVVHVSHSELAHCYSGEFPYTDTEIADAYIEMLNEALDGVPESFELRFENHWLPGLTFLDAGVAMKLLERVTYPRKGLVLDISHLMNTNPGLSDEQEAVDYILQRLKDLGEAQRHIRTVHLNSSIRGTRRITGSFDAGADFITRLITAMKHVGAMDPHRPFEDGAILRVLDAVQPEHLVYELGSKSLEELRAAVSAQNRALGIV
jgi:hypothetical protein